MVALRSTALAAGAPASARVVASTSAATAMATRGSQRRGSRRRALARGLRRDGWVMRAGYLPPAGPTLNPIPTPGLLSNPTLETPFGETPSGNEPARVGGELAALGGAEMRYVTSLGGESLVRGQHQVRVVARDQTPLEHVLQLLDQVLTRDRVRHVLHGLGEDAAGKVRVRLDLQRHDRHVTEREPAQRIDRSY